MKKIEFLYTNELINESSPYLLQHAHNPVNWYPWGEKALEKAKKENKLLLVSIGYSACHWCHVMEHESFENPDIAAYMNDHFVSIKVDREERPDIDQVYMNAVQLLSGRGGWPLNCIALPDGRPIYGGTYFPPSQWLDMLKQVNEFVKTHPKETEEQAQKLTEGIQNQEMIYISEESAEASLDFLSQVFSAWKNLLDYTNGGNTGAPKFPLPVGYQYLLFYHYITGDQDALRATSITLHKMAYGGIYDQLGGGFARYATDEKWIIPHFEKMLYDNAQLVSLYSSAYQIEKEKTYRKVVEKTIEFILREMSSEEGGFYSSLDADSEGEEGKFYTWKQAEVKALLGKNAEPYLSYYSISENGNWEDEKNILFSPDEKEAVKLAEDYKFSEKEFGAYISEANIKLFNHREERIRPGTDEKILTSWNALMLKGFTDAYLTFDKQAYLDAALKNAAFLRKNMIAEDYRILRNYKDGSASINGFLDDYAFTISAFINLYRATFEEHWLNDARTMLEYAILHFYDEESGMFFYTSDLDPELVARKFEVTDNVIPSGNSEMAKNLYMLGKYFFEDEYERKATRMYSNVKEHTLRGGPYFANWNILAAWLAAEPAEVLIVGKDFRQLLKVFNMHYLPDVIFSGGENEGALPILKQRLVKGQTTIYVCKQRVCQIPTTNVSEALKQIAALKK